MGQHLSRLSAKLRRTACIIALGTGLAGCGDESATSFSNTSTAASDEEAIGMIIAEDSENFGFGTELDENVVEVGGIDLLCHQPAFLPGMNAAAHP